MLRSTAHYVGADSLGKYRLACANFDSKAMIRYAINKHLNRFISLDSRMLKKIAIRSSFPRLGIKMRPNLQPYQNVLLIIQANLANGGTAQAWPKSAVKPRKGPMVP